MCGRAGVQEREQVWSFFSSQSLSISLSSLLSYSACDCHVEGVQGGREERWRSDADTSPGCALWPWQRLLLRSFSLVFSGPLLYSKWPWTHCPSEGCPVPQSVGHPWDSISIPSPTWGSKKAITHPCLAKRLMRCLIEINFHIQSKGQEWSLFGAF